LISTQNTRYSHSSEHNRSISAQKVKWMFNKVGEILLGEPSQEG
jgi:hypothetical protein